MVEDRVEEADRSEVKFCRYDRVQRRRVSSIAGRDDRIVALLTRSSRRVAQLSLLATNNSSSSTLVYDWKLFIVRVVYFFSVLFVRLVRSFRWF